MEALTVVALITVRACGSVSHFHIHALVNRSRVGTRSHAHLCPSSLWELAKWSHTVLLYACDSFSGRFEWYVKGKLYLKVKKEDKETDWICFTKHISKVSCFGEDGKLRRLIKLVSKEKVIESPLEDGVVFPIDWELNSSLKLVKPVLDAERERAWNPPAFGKLEKLQINPTGLLPFLFYNNLIPESELLELFA